MNKLNPIFDAVSDIDDKTVADFIPKYKTKPPKALKIAAVAVAAALLLGTTAAAATLGDDPIVKINNKQVTPWYSSYVNENGWTVKTTAVEIPFAYCRYRPVGEIRAVFYSNSSDIRFYDELGVRLDDITDNINFYINAEKPGENPFSGAHGTVYEDYHQSETITPEGEILIDIWQDPVQAVKSANAKKRYENMTVDERIEEMQVYGDLIEFSEFGGFEHPSMRELFEADGMGLYSITNNAVKFECIPSEAMKLYKYAPVSINGFSEKAGTTVVLYTNAVLTEDKTRYTFIGDKEITQQMFVYTLVEEQSGTEVLFTVWRSAENKDTYTDHFDFEYEYIQLNNGTQARLHQSADNSYFLEFEKDGAAYGLQIGRERDLAESILEKMELL